MAFDMARILPLSALLLSLAATAQITAPATAPAALPDGAGQTATSAVAPAPAAVVMPSDPNELMKLAAQVNGLGAPGLKPWHLKASYQSFDLNDNPKEFGVFEEWWAAPDKYKIAYASPSFSQTQYITSGGTFFTGEQQWPNDGAAATATNLLDPLPRSGAEKRFAGRETKLGSVELNCLQQAATGPANSRMAMMTATYCFSKISPAIRLIANGGRQIITFNDIVVFGGQYVARQISTMIDRLPQMTVNVLALEPLDVIRDAAFVPPADAKPAPERRIAVAGGVIAGFRVGGNAPEYPAIAMDHGIKGTVALEVVISKEGAIKDLHVISGPSVLQQAAVDAVKTWRYRPYLLNGAPVELQTEINIVFGRP
jgi:TonB family protein